jgi:hypothetical protein
VSDNMHWLVVPLLQLPALLLIFKGCWTLKFPRAWRGRRVTVCSNGRTYMERMERIRKDLFELWTLPWPENYSSVPPRAFYFKDEGVTWCMGWRGPRVRALKSAWAMSRQR